MFDLEIKILLSDLYNAIQEDRITKEKFNDIYFMIEGYRTGRTNVELSEINEKLLFIIKEG